MRAHACEDFVSVICQVACERMFYFRMLQYVWQLEIVI